jgi:hypothetical protein
MGSLFPARLLAVVLCGVSVGCYDANKITAPDEVMLLTASPDVIAANGFAISQITAHVDPASASKFTISFKTSVDALTIPNGQTRRPDSNGDVVVHLTSDTTPKTVIVTAEAKDGTNVVASRSVPVVFEAASAASVVRLSVSSSQLEADGVSSVIIRAEVSPSFSSRQVTFRTTNGSFSRGSTPLTETTVTAGADGVAIVPLYAASSLGSAVVTATVNGFSASQTVSFVAAAPDFMTLTATPLTVSKALDTNLTTLVAVLSRSIGAVSGNTRVEFSIVNDTTGEANFGRFETQSRTSTDGEVTTTTRYFPGIAAPLGLATITARVPDTNVTARVKINITP